MGEDHRDIPVGRLGQTETENKSQLPPPGFPSVSLMLRFTVLNPFAWCSKAGWNASGLILNPPACARVCVSSQFYQCRALFLRSVNIHWTWKCGVSKIVLNNHHLKVGWAANLYSHLHPYIFNIFSFLSEDDFSILLLQPLTCCLLNYKWQIYILSPFVSM